MNNQARSLSRPTLYLAALGAVFLLEPGGSSTVSAATSANKLNVLFITVDDLRPELGAYGVHEIETPNIDRLAEQGTRFTRAYTQMATCSPSRTSVMTGLRPDTTRVTDLETHFRDTIPSVVTLPQYFQQSGYETQGICKVYHGGATLDDPQSWSIPYVQVGGKANPTGPDGKLLPYAAIDAPTSDFGDGACADFAIESLQQLKDKPFFLAVGFRKPHLPFVAPSQYFEMYDPNTIPEAGNPFRAAGAPDFAFDDAAEVRMYSGIPPRGEPLSANLRRELKRGYYAATSFVDAQVGRLLDELERLGLSDDTLVVLWGDHGWHLGEQDEWGKHTNFEVGARVPLIVRVPGRQPAQTSTAIVELVDLFPTIVELAGLPIPNAQQHGGYPLEGQSLAGLIDDPLIMTKRGAFSQWSQDGYVGHSIRTDRYRFTEWVHWSNRKVFELYDHLLDPSETVNVFSDPAYSSVIPDLRSALAAGGGQDLPPSLLADVVLGDRLGVWRPNTGSFYLDLDGSQAWTEGVDLMTEPFGLPGDVPLAGDWNGDGADDIGVWRPSAGRFFLDLDGSDTWAEGQDLISEPFGLLTDRPVAGDWNGDGIDEIGVWRPSTGRFYLDADGNHSWEKGRELVTGTLGLPDDVPVVGDWNGDGSDEIGVWRPSTGRFYLDADGSLTWGEDTDIATEPFGMVGDLPTIGDWNRDGIDEVGVWRASTGRFYLDVDGSGSWKAGVDVETESFGVTGDQPVAGRW